MTAYNNIDEAIAGLKYGLDSKTETFRAIEAVEFGKPVFGHKDDPLNGSTLYRDVGKIVFDADFVTSNTIDITVNTVAAAQVTFTTDHDTTAALVVAAVAALTGVECVLDPADATNRTFLIRAKRTEVVVTEDVQAGAGQAAGTITYDTSMIYLGIAQFTQKEASSTAEYVADEPMNVMVLGTIYGSVTVAIIEALAKAYVDDNGAGRGDWTDVAGFDTLSLYRNNAASGALPLIEIVSSKGRGTYAEINFS